MEEENSKTTSFNINSNKFQESAPYLIGNRNGTKQKLKSHYPFVKINGEIYVMVEDGKTGKYVLRELTKFAKELSEVVQELGDTLKY